VYLADASVLARARYREISSMLREKGDPRFDEGTDGSA